MNTTIFNDQNNEYIEDYFNALLPKDDAAPESESWQTFTRGLFGTIQNGKKKDVSNNEMSFRQCSCYERATY